MTIPAGTKLYRSAPNICIYSKNIQLQKRQCTNTGKHGVYFSTYLFQALAMAIEYNKNLELGEFVTTVDIPVSIGKYSFRYIDPKRYFHINVRHNNIIQKLHTMPTDEEDISHFNQEILPIVEFNDEAGNHVNYNMDSFSSSLKPTDGEVFVTNDDVLKSIKLLKTYTINVEKLKEIVRDHIDDLHPYSYTFYKNALHKIKCSVNTKSAKGGKYTRKRIRK